jgi:hypothetical protein
MPGKKPVEAALRDEIPFAEADALRDSNGFSEGIATRTGRRGGMMTGGESFLQPEGEKRGEDFLVDP